MANEITNGSATPSRPISLSIPLPHAPTTKISLQLTLESHHTLLFLTTSTSDSPSGLCSLGSFVYALPNRLNPSQPLSTPLYSMGDSLDFATRMAKLLAKKLGVPCYVGNSMNFSGMGRGGDVEEEMEGFRLVVKVVMSEVEKAGLLNGGVEGLSLRET
ncbi:hypothetical protein FKW77_005123 [Venturia effusa]|uniref:Uncharacterized protein n=1 Tax=Venturia effusa TaxID=50376 RepID=A0A517LQ51_9PEZI|nr:hypothetical protein FKW77_005123 [Venturia effusa]